MAIVVRHTRALRLVLAKFHAADTALALIVLPTNALAEKDGEMVTARNAHALKANRGSRTHRPRMLLIVIEPSAAMLVHAIEQRESARVSQASPVLPANGVSSVFAFS